MIQHRMMMMMMMQHYRSFTFFLSSFLRTSFHWGAAGSSIITVQFGSYYTRTSTIKHRYITVQRSQAYRTVTNP